MSFFSILTSVFQKEIKEPEPMKPPTPKKGDLLETNESPFFSSQTIYKIKTADTTGKYQTKKYSLNGRNYNILNYEDGSESGDNGVYRSVVVNDDTKEVLSFSPPRSLSPEEFSEKNPDISDSSRYLATKTVEGTMINLFYDRFAETPKWEIATKKAVGGEYSYFSGAVKKTFRDMFLDSFNGLILWNTSYDTRDIKDVNWFSKLNTRYTYTFVLQHPMNHIVYPVVQPKLYLVSVHEVGEYSETTGIQNVRFVPFAEYSEWDAIQEGIKCRYIYFPETVKAQSTVAEYYSANCSLSKFADKVGVMICDQATGDRVHLENEGYKNLKELRGNNANFIANYIRLMRLNRVRDFYVAFPMYREECNKLYSSYHNLITAVHDKYIAYYVNKNKEPIDKPLFVHVARIHHNLRLGEKGKKLKITHRIVREYFDKMDEASLFYLLNKYT